MCLPLLGQYYIKFVCISSVYPARVRGGLPKNGSRHEWRYEKDISTSFTINTDL